MWHRRLINIEDVIAKIMQWSISGIDLHCYCIAPRGCFTNVVT